jgi:hypothetical protein
MFVAITQSTIFFKYGGGSKETTGLQGYSIHSAHAQHKMVMVMMDTRGLFLVLVNGDGSDGDDGHKRPIPRPRQW